MPISAKSKTEKSLSFKSPPGRGHYVTMVTPKAQEEGGKEWYGFLLALQKDEDTTKKFMVKCKARIVAACREKFGKFKLSKESKLSEFREALKHFPIYNGDAEAYADKEELHGCWLFRLKNGFRPQVCDTKGEILDSAEELYSGAIYRAKVSVWAWKNKFGKGVSLNLESALKTDDGERIGGGSKATEDFAEDIVEDGSDESEDGDDDGDE